MKNKELKGILALVVVTALSFAVIAGSRALSQNMTDAGENTQAKVTEEYDVSSDENIAYAAKTEEGYLVTARQKGYNGDIVMDVFFDSDAETVTKVAITQQSETEGLGARITESAFLSQFEGAKAPVYLPEMTLPSTGAHSTDSNDTDLATLESARLTDGTYTATTGSFDDSGFMDEVTLTVKDGRIADIIWEAITEDGAKKSVMSENGEYTMTEDGLTWKEQAEALADALIENQSLSFLTTDEKGKTDAVSGVSISINGFIRLAQQCLMEAAGMLQENDGALREDSGTLQEDADGTDAAINGGSSHLPDGTQIDAVSGATISSTAAVTAVNNAYYFLQAADKTGDSI